VIRFLCASPCLAFINVHLLKTGLRPVARFIVEGTKLQAPLDLASSLRVKISEKYGNN
jgi:hypothetical protein